MEVTKQFSVSVVADTSVSVLKNCKVQLGEGLPSHWRNTTVKAVLFRRLDETDGTSMSRVRVYLCICCLS